MDTVIKSNSKKYIKSKEQEYINKELDFKRCVVKTLATRLSASGIFHTSKLWMISIISKKNAIFQVEAWTILLYTNSTNIKYNV